MKILIVGDSHTAALALGLASLQAEGGLDAQVQVRVIPFFSADLLRTAFFVDDGATARIADPRNPARSLTLPPPGEHFDLYCIAAPLQSIQVIRDADWSRFSLSGETGAAPVSRSLFRQVVLDDQRHVFEFLGFLLRNRVNLAVIEAPHPFPHHPQVQRLGAGRVAELDLAYRAVVRGELARLGVPVIDVPPETVNKDGLTEDAYRSPRTGDNNHASPAFGALMMRRIVAFALQSN